MPSLLFWLFTALMLIFAGAVVINRNPVASALSLVVSFLCLAALFVGLDAFLIGVMQVLVYAGAVMVLFLFIIMLLDLRAEERRKLNLLAIAGGGAVTLAFVVQLWVVLRRFEPGQHPFPTDRQERRRRPSDRHAHVYQLQPAAAGRRRAGPGRHDRCGRPLEKGASLA